MKFFFDRTKVKTISEGVGQAFVINVKLKLATYLGLFVVMVFLSIPMAFIGFGLKFYRQETMAERDKLERVLAENDETRRVKGKGCRC